MQITFSCGSGARPYDYTFKFDDVGDTLDLDVVSGGTIIEPYRDMLRQFGQRCPWFEKGPPVMPSLQYYIVNVANNTLKTSITQKAVYLMKQKAIARSLRWFYEESHNRCGPYKRYEMLKYWMKASLFHLGDG
ncbi:hypothetical protein FOL47_009485, partial [Perkinsus chesapeaki]